jgi:hypothetical protein
MEQRRGPSAPHDRGTNPPGSRYLPALQISIETGARMRSWFGRRLATDSAVLPPDGLPGNGLEAYREGRADERQRLQRDGVHVDRATVDAYERGRREERLRHRGSPFLALITILLVVMAVAILFLAIKTGSFSNDR